MSESDIEADYSSDTESTSIVESNVPESDSEPKMTNSEFISLLFSITLRSIIYGVFIVFLFIFVHGKSMDKVGYDRIIKALTLEEQKPGVNLENSTCEKFTFTNSTYYTAENTNANTNHELNQPVAFDIQIQRQELLKLSLQCHQLEQKLQLPPDQGQCNKDHLSIHELVLDPELELNARTYHLTLLELLQLIENELYQKDEVSNISEKLVGNEFAKFTFNTFDLVESLQSTLLEKLRSDHEAILLSKQDVNVNNPDPEVFIDNKDMEKTINERVSELLNQYINKRK